MRAVAVVALALLTCFGVAACGGSTEQSGQATTAAPTDTRPAETQPAETQPAETQTDVPERASAPALTGSALDGASVALVDFRGRPVLINVWSSW